ncbi:MAG: cell division protein ZapA [Muribaculaceae bacterium]|nr:cell division protein ZapA [Muribaculaceae bacterium]
MSQQHEHRITIKIADAEAFKLPVKESEESFYRHVVEQINNNVNRFTFGANADSPDVALAKVALYYATMLYRQTNLINSQADMLADFERRIDNLLKGSD